jgi:hypothetical protein
MAEYIFVIYSCQKNLEIANKMHTLYFSNTQLLNSLKMKVLIAYGDTTIGHQFLVKDDKYLVLHCEDDYENLCSKSIRLFKAINYLYPNADGCFKCDDDVIINMKSLIDFIRFLKTKTIHYAGTSVVINEKNDNNTLMIAKNIKENNKPFGGIQLVVFGDFLQLPPVSTDKNERRFCFETSK